jgi:hypothetical protein
MNQRIPPRFALWIVERYGSSYNSESLAGDLIEQFHQGESRWWLWKQVVIAILITRVGRIRQILLLPALRLLLRISIDVAAMLILCTIADRSSHTHSFREMLTPNFLVTIAVLVTAAAIALSIFIGTSRRRRPDTLFKSLAAAFMAITLGFGALTWAGTTRDNSWKSESCLCPKVVGAGCAHDSPGLP